MDKLELHSWNQAWMAAESLAWRNRHTHAIVYKRYQNSRTSFEARLATDTADTELMIATTVSRKPLPNGADEGSCEALVDALAFVLMNLPYKVELAPLLRVEHSASGKIWAHYFLSIDQEEIASWSQLMVEFFPGMNGGGRPIGVNQNDKIIRIDALIAEAQLLLKE